MDGSDIDVRRSADSRAKIRGFGNTLSRIANNWERTDNSDRATAIAAPGTCESVRSPSASSTAVSEVAADNFHPRDNFRKDNIGSPALGDPNHVPTGIKVSASPPECLPHKSLDTIATDGISDFAGDCDPDSGRRKFSSMCGSSIGGLKPSPARKHEKLPDMYFLTPPLDAKKLAPAPDPTKTLKAFWSHLPPTLTLRRLRPRRRRPARILRPFRVDMRARNPWVRDRLKLCG